jgi:YfiH family protein
MIDREDVIPSDPPRRRERLVVENGHWTLRWEGVPGIRAGLSGRRVVSAAGSDPIDPMPTAHVQQVHGCDIVTVTDDGFAGEADGLVTTRHDLRLVIRVADCLPVLLVAPGGASLVHAGWRGAAGDIVGRALRQLLAASGAAPADVVAWIGPAIGTCCFEVGPEVATVFPPSSRRIRQGRSHVDLPNAVAGQLRVQGVPNGAIDVSRYCTRCHQHLWHSHRGSGGRPGRLTAWVSRHPQDDSSVVR